MILNNLILSIIYVLSIHQIACLKELNPHWWNMADSALPETSNMITSSGHTMYLGLHAQPLTKKQRRLVDKNHGSLVCIMKGVKIAVTECKHQFKNDKWNCPTFDARHGKAIFGKILNKACRETAFVYAITSAGVTHEIARACSKGSITTCGCDPRYPNHQQLPGYLKGSSEDNSLYGDEGGYENSDFSQMSSRHMDDRHAMDGLTDVDLNNGHAKGEKLSSGNGPNWKWGGCSDNIKFGRKFARKFVNSAEKGHDLRYLVNAHNNGAGRGAVIRSMTKVCKCQGLSGSCNLKTCWMRVAPFRTVGKTLKIRYDDASKVASNNNLVPEQKSQHRNSAATNTDAMESNYIRRAKGYEDNPTREGRDNRAQEASLLEAPSRHKKFNYFSEERYYPASPEVAASSTRRSLNEGDGQDGVGWALREKYRRWKEVQASRMLPTTQGLTRSGRWPKTWSHPSSSLTGQTFKIPKRSDLVYYEDSPDFCDYKPAIGSTGTRNRQCVLNGSGPDGCSNMCCDRGYTSRKVLIVERCNCTFQWCCHVKCQECQTQKIISTCM